MPSLSSFRTALHRRAADPTVVEPAISNAPENGNETVVFCSALDQVIAAALADIADDKATSAEKHASKASQLARSLTLAILAAAAESKPDVRAIVGWRMLLECDTAADLATAVSKTLGGLKDAMAALDAERGSKLATAPCGPDAYRRGTTGGLGKGKLKSPVAIQSTYRLLHDAHQAAKGQLANPAQSCRTIAATCKSMPETSRKSKIAA